MFPSQPFAYAPLPLTHYAHFVYLCVCVFVYGKVASFTICQHFFVVLFQWRLS